MATQTVDAKGLLCPQPTLKLTSIMVRCKPGDVLDVLADCPTFEADVRSWCARMKKTLLWVRDEGDGVKRCQIRR